MRIDPEDEVHRVFLRCSTDGPNLSVDFRVDLFIDEGSSPSTTVLSQGTSNNLTHRVKERPITQECPGTVYPEG